MPNEFDVINAFLAPLSPDGLIDDVALLPKAGTRTTQIITTDSLIEGVHFWPHDPISGLGEKLVRVNVSDIYAKGGRPIAALFNLGWPTTREREQLAAFLQGFYHAFEHFNIVLLGGDTVNSPVITLSLTLIGECGPRGPVTRAGAQIGDQVWLTGKIGLGYYGLRDAKTETDTEARSHYHRPCLVDPALVPLLAKHATASLDVSDGLLQDAQHLSTQSKVCLKLELGQIPIYHPQTNGLKARTENLPLLCAGDDYQILFTANPEKYIHFQSFATHIGQVEEGVGIKLMQDQTLIPLPDRLGYEHRLGGTSNE